MATLDDVEVGLCQALAALIFPNPSYQFRAVETCAAPYTDAGGAVTLSIPTKLYVGDPNTTALDADLNSGVANITVHRTNGLSRNTTRFQPHRITTSKNVASLNTALGANQVTFGGTAAAGQVVGVTVATTCYAYAVQPSDGIPSIVQALASAIPGATGAGAVLLAQDITSAAVAVRQTGLFVTGQQEQVFSVKIYAPPVSAPVAASGFLVRSALGGLVNQLKSLRRPDGSLTRFIGLPDGSKARVEFYGEANNDRVDRANMWIRQVDFLVEYDETVTETPMTALAPMIAGNMNGARIMWLGRGASANSVMTDGMGNLLVDSSGSAIGSMA